MNVQASVTTEELPHKKDRTRADAWTNKCPQIRVKKENNLFLDNKASYYKSILLSHKKTRSFKT